MMICKIREKLVCVSVGTVNSDMLPMTSEQGDVASRVESLGAGIRIKRRDGKAVRDAPSG